MQTTPAHGVHIDWEAGESIQIGGFGTRVRVPAAMTNGSTTIVEHTLAAGTLGSPLHRHSREDETSYVLEGVLSVQVGDEVLSAGPREIVVKLKGEFHAFWNAGETPLRFLEVISPGGFEAYFAELARIVPRTVLPRWARSARSGRASPRVRLRQYRRADGASRCAPRMSPASSPSVSEGDAFRHRRASGPRPPGQVSTHTGAVGHVVDTIAPRSPISRDEQHCRLPIEPVLHWSLSVNLRPMRLVPATLVLLLAGAGCTGGGDADADAAPPASGTSARSAVAAPASGPPSPPIPECPVPVCRYEGTSWAEDLIGDDLLDRGEARVTWRFSHMNGREAIYLAAGTATAAWTMDDCTITLEPAVHAFTAAPTPGAPRGLQVDFTTRPVQYRGVGSSAWPGTQTWSCPNDDPFTQDGVTTKWFEAYEMTSHDPGLLKGTYESETVRSGWEFTNAP